MNCQKLETGNWKLGTGAGSWPALQNQVRAGDPPSFFVPFCAFLWLFHVFCKCLGLYQFRWRGRVEFLAHATRFAGSSLRLGRPSAWRRFLVSSFQFPVSKPRPLASRNSWSPNAS